MSIKLTERDVKLFHWLNGFGFATVEQIAKYWKVSNVCVYRRTRGLAEAGYLTHERIFHGKPGIYRVTAEGVKVAGHELSALKKINLQSYHHDLDVLNLSFSLLKEHGDNSQFLPERWLRHEKGLKGVGQKGHIPDGVFATSDGQKYAIELELSLKGSRRRKRILDGYLKNFDYAEVWYFCSRDTYQSLTDEKNNYKFLKVMEWNGEQNKHL